MVARVDDSLVVAAAEALVAAAKTLTNEQGLKLHNSWTPEKAKSAIMGALVAGSGLGYPSALMPTGWTEIDWSKRAADKT